MPKTENINTEATSLSRESVRPSVCQSTVCIELFSLLSHTSMSSLIIVYVSLFHIVELLATSIQYILIIYLYYIQYITEIFRFLSRVSITISDDEHGFGHRVDVFLKVQHTALANQDHRTKL